MPRNQCFRYNLLYGHTFWYLISMTLDFFKIVTWIFVNFTITAWMHPTLCWGKFRKFPAWLSFQSIKAYPCLIWTIIDDQLTQSVSLSSQWLVFMTFFADRVLNLSQIGELFNTTCVWDARTANSYPICSLSVWRLRVRSLPWWTCPSH